MQTYDAICLFSSPDGCQWAAGSRAHLAAHLAAEVQRAKALLEEGWTDDLNSVILHNDVPASWAHDTNELSVSLEWLAVCEYSQKK